MKVVPNDILKFGSEKVNVKVSLYRHSPVYLQYLHKNLIEKHPKDSYCHSFQDSISYKSFSSYLSVTQLNQTLFPEFMQEILIQYTVKLPSLEVVGIIFMRQNHPKCELNLHFEWFWLVKMAPHSNMSDCKTKNIISSQPMYWDTTYLSYPCSTYRGLTVVTPI